MTGQVLPTSAAHELENFHITSAAWCIRVKSQSQRCLLQQLEPPHTTNSVIYMPSTLIRMWNNRVPAAYCSGSRAGTSTYHELSLLNVSNSDKYVWNSRASAAYCSGSRAGTSTFCEIGLRNITNSDACVQWQGHVWNDRASAAYCSGWRDGTSTYHKLNFSNFTNFIFWMSRTNSDWNVWKDRATVSFWSGGKKRYLLLRKYALQHTATHCNTLQYTSTHCSICNALPHTAMFTDSHVWRVWFICVIWQGKSQLLKRWQKRYFVLYPSLLMYWAEERDFISKKKPKACVELMGCSLATAEQVCVAKCYVKRAMYSV